VRGRADAYLISFGQQVQPRVPMINIPIAEAALFSIRPVL